MRPYNNLWYMVRLLPPQGIQLPARKNVLSYTLKLKHVRMFSSAVSRIFREKRVNAVAVDALAPFVVRSSTAMVTTNYKRHVILRNKIECSSNDNSTARIKCAGHFSLDRPNLNYKQHVHNIWGTLNIAITEFILNTISRYRYYLFLNKTKPKQEKT